MSAFRRLMSKALCQTSLSQTVLSVYSNIIKSRQGTIEIAGDLCRASANAPDCPFRLTVSAF